jgi:hypothetical protein
MVRQCAWCLCLMNSIGERLSSSPRPKLYEASHGICSVCGIIWLSQAIEATNNQNVVCTKLDNSHKLSITEENSSLDYEEQEEPAIHFSLQSQPPMPQPFSIPKVRRQTMPL